jgi:hypothetical protein
MSDFDKEESLQDILETPTSTANDDNAIGPKNKRNGDDTSRVLLPFWASRAARKQLKYIALEEGKTQQNLLTEALNMLFEQRRRLVVG